MRDGSETLFLENWISGRCPCSGGPVRVGPSSRYRGAVVGVCSPGRRDKVERAAVLFDVALDQDIETAARR